MPYKYLLTTFVLSALFIAAAHPHHGPIRSISPASGAYQLTLPATWYESRRFDEPVQDAGDKLYLAETETMFEAWRDGKVIGPVLQVSSAPLGEDTTLSADEALKRSLAGVPEGALETHTLGGNPALTYRGFPYRSAPHTAMTVVLAGDRLFYLVYAADRAEHFLEIEAVVDSFEASRVARNASSVEDGLRQLVGRPAPAFRAQLMDGSAVTLSDYRGKAVVLNFWATMCYGCQEEMKMFERVSRGRDDVAFLSINWRDAPGLIQKFTDQHDLSLPVALDRAGLISDRYNVDVFPATVLIDEEGVVRLTPQFEMSTTQADVAGWLEQLKQ